MPAVAAYPQTNSNNNKHSNVDFEPDEEWKSQLKKRIEDSLESMVREVKENQAAELRKAVVTSETRLRIAEDYKQAMNNIKTIAAEQYQEDLDFERNQRRWTTGVPLNPEWSRILTEEQQRIMDTIKQSSNQDDKDATGSPTDERRPVQPSQTGVVRESAKSPRSASQAPQAISHIAPSSKEDREQSVGSPVEPPRSARRGSDARNAIPRGRDDRSGSIRRRRDSRSNRPGELESPDQPEELPHLQAPYSKSPADQPPPSPEVNRLNSSLGRNGSMRSASSQFSPPKPVSDVWKSTAALEDDASAAKSYNLGRRGSSASIKSTGSGTAVRPAISETIPERVDDAEGDFGSNDRGSHEREKVHKHHREARRAGRKNSRSTTADALSYSDEPLLSAPMWSAGPSSMVMQLATSTAPAKSLTSKPSFVNGEERYHRDHYREPPYSARDAPTRAIPPRPPYGLDDRDYPVSYQTPHRPPKPLYGRDHPSIPSFNKYDEKYDRHRDYDWDGERDYDDDDRERGKEGESEYRENWERDYSEHRYPNHYYPSRSPGYPATSRHTSHDYVHMHDLHDDRENPPRSRGYGYRGHGPPPSPPDEWDQRPESVPTRQPSYSRDDRDQYSRGYPSSNSIPISSRHGPSSEDLPLSSWREWGVDGNGTRRLSDSRYDSYARSPSNAEHFSRRRQPRYNGDATHSDLSPSSSRRKKPPPPPLDGSRRDLDYEETLDESDSDEEPIVGQSEEDENYLAQAKELEDERRQADERIKERAAEIRRLQEEQMRLEEEARRKEEEVKKKEEEMRRKEEESKRVEDEIRKEAEAVRKAEEAKRKEEEAKRKEREARRKEQEAARKADDAKKLAMEAGRKADEAKRKEDEINKKEERARKKEERLKEDAERTRKLQLEANRITKEAQLKQEALEILEQETRRKEQEIEERERALKAREEELKIREEEARKLEEGAWRKEEDARRKEAEAKRKELEAKKKEEEVMRKDEETRRKEMETRTKEEEARRRDEEAARVRQEMFRREQSVRRGQDSDIFEEGFLEDYDLKFLEGQAKLLQQAQYRKREEEIRRNREERKRQDSIGSESAWSAPSTLPSVPKPFPPLATSQPPYTTPSPTPNGNPAAWTTWGAPPLKPSNITSSATSRSTSTTLPQLNKPRNGSVSSGSHPTSTSPHTATPISESEWARRHAEFTNNQQEKFRREQEKLESERQVRAAGKPLSRDEVQRVFEHHDRLWARLPTISELTWVDFPWPVLRTASNADDITFTFVNAYFQSPFLLEKEKSRSLKDRIKEHLRRWHPDRFESKVLPRVVELEKEKVKQGAGNVVRYLNDLLRKENENGSIPNLFGE